MKPAILFTVTTTVLVLSNAVFAHEVYKEPMQKRYNLKTVSCKTCHPNSKDRSIHNKFGQYFEEELKGKDVTKGYEEAKEKGEEAEKAYEEIMVKQFEEAMKIVEKKKMTFEDLIKAGLLNGVRLKTPK